MTFARWVTEKLPKVGDRIYHKRLYVTGIHDFTPKEGGHGWGIVLRRLGDPGGMFCEVRFEQPTDNGRETRIVSNSDCHFSPEHRYEPKEQS